MIKHTTNIDDVITQKDITSDFFQSTTGTILLCVLFLLLILSYLLPSILEFISDIYDAINIDKKSRKSNIYRRDVVDGYMIFYAYSKFKYKRIKININNLSKITALELRERIQYPLLNLYVEAKYNKAAEKVFKANSAYILTIAEDLRKAISQCDTEKMEMILCSRLHILCKTIKSIDDDMEEAQQLEEYEENAFNDLKAQSYEPFTLTDNINKLL